MNPRQWLLGALNSGLKQAAKAALTILSSYVVGVHLDVVSLALAYSVGFIWGVLEWQYQNSIPDDPVVTTLRPPIKMTDQISK